MKRPMGSRTITACTKGEGSGARGACDDEDCACKSAFASVEVVLACRLRRLAPRIPLLGLVCPPTKLLLLVDDSDCRDAPVDGGDCSCVRRFFGWRAFRPQ